MLVNTQAHAHTHAHARAHTHNRRIRCYKRRHAAGEAGVLQGVTQRAYLVRQRLLRPVRAPSLSGEGVGKIVMGGDVCARTCARVRPSVCMRVRVRVYACAYACACVRVRVCMWVGCQQKIKKVELNGSSTNYLTNTPQLLVFYKKIQLQ